MPDNFPIQQKDRLFSNAIFLNLLLKQPSLLLNGEVIWQAKELHGQTNRQADGKRKREREEMRAKASLSDIGKTDQKSFPISRC